MRGVRWGAGLWVASMLVAGAAQGQNVEVQTDRGPHYAGDPITVQIVASQFDEEPTPEVRVGDLAGARLRFAGVSDSSSTSISFVNGQLTRSKEVRFVYRYELIADGPGRLRLPEFEVSQGATTRRTAAFELKVQGVPTTGLVSLDVVLPKAPIFVGQKVPVDVVLRLDREAQRDLLSIDSVVPLFDQANLRFLDDPSAASDAKLEIRTMEGVIALPATMSEEEIDGRTVLILRARRTLIPLTPEVLEVAPARVLISRGTRFRRDLFNQRQATSMERLMAEGDPVRLEVIEVPRQGRPASFAGAVGEGFSLEVSADRSVVQLGEPILLTFDLRGDGDLSTAGLPPFDAEGLFDPNLFRLPEEPPAGLLEEGGKRFESSVRVLDAAVREVPAIAYSWFDAKTRRFETTYSRPIALSVGAAEIIGADAVARRPGLESGRQEGEVGGDSSLPAPGAEPPPAMVRSTSLAVSGANLAVDSDPGRVLGTGAASRAMPLVQPIFYGLGLGVLGFAAFERRRRGLDPVERARAAAYTAAQRSIEAAAVAPPDGAAGELGRALRELIAADPTAANAEFDALLQECDALRFAPGGGSGLPSGLVERARAFAVSRRDLAVEERGAS